LYGFGEWLLVKLKRSKEAGEHLADGDQLIEELVVER
jgi:hypothetical protein